MPWYTSPAARPPHLIGNSSFVHLLTGALHNTTSHHDDMLDVVTIVFNLTRTPHRVMAVVRTLDPPSSDPLCEAPPIASEWEDLWASYGSAVGLMGFDGLTDPILGADLHPEGGHGWGDDGEDVAFTVQVLLGIGPAVSIPAFFWSNPVAYLGVAYRMAFCMLKHEWKYLPDTWSDKPYPSPGEMIDISRSGISTEVTVYLIRRVNIILRTTQATRQQCVESGIFPGWVPMDLGLVRSTEALDALDLALVWNLDGWRKWCAAQIAASYGVDDMDEMDISEASRTWPGVDRNTTLAGFPGWPMVLDLSVKAVDLHKGCDNVTNSRRFATATGSTVDGPTSNSAPNISGSTSGVGRNITPNNTSTSRNTLASPPPYLAPPFTPFGHSSGDSDSPPEPKRRWHIVDTQAHSAQARAENRQLDLPGYDLPSSMSDEELNDTLKIEDKVYARIVDQLPFTASMYAAFRCSRDYSRPWNPALVRTLVRGQNPYTARQVDPATPRVSGQFRVPLSIVEAASECVVETDAAMSVSDPGAARAALRRIAMRKAAAIRAQKATKQQQTGPNLEASRQAYMGTIMRQAQAGRARQGAERGEARHSLPSRRWVSRPEDMGMIMEQIHAGRAAQAAERGQAGQSQEEPSLEATRHAFMGTIMRHALQGRAQRAAEGDV